MRREHPSGGSVAPKLANSVVCSKKLATCLLILIIGCSSLGNVSAYSMEPRDPTPLCQDEPGPKVGGYKEEFLDEFPTRRLVNATGTAIYGSLLIIEGFRELLSVVIDWAFWRATNHLYNRGILDEPKRLPTWFRSAIAGFITFSVIWYIFLRDEIESFAWVALIGIAIGLLIYTIAPLVLERAIGWLL